MVPGTRLQCTRDIHRRPSQKDPRLSLCLLLRYYWQPPTTTHGICTHPPYASPLRPSIFRSVNYAKPEAVEIVWESNRLPEWGTFMQRMTEALQMTETGSAEERTNAVTQVLLLFLVLDGTYENVISEGLGPFGWSHDALRFTSNMIGEPENAEFLFISLQNTSLLHQQKATKLQLQAIHKDSFRKASPAKSQEGEHPTRATTTTTTTTTTMTTTKVNNTNNQEIYLQTQDGSPTAAVATQVGYQHSADHLELLFS
eukprot:gene4050-2259_t